MKPKKQKDTSHVWYVTSLKRIPWAICDKCGLIRLHNKATDAKASAKCPGREDD